MQKSDSLQDGTLRMMTNITKLLVIQATPFCNISCSYCYLPDRDNSSKMSISNLEVAVANFFDNFQVGEKLTVIWHSGEPLVVGPKYFIDAINIINAIKPESVTVNYEVQTNGILIDETWKQLYLRDDFHFGLSLDGPEHIHDKNRLYRNGAGSFKKAMQGLQCLQKANVSFSVICVLDQNYISNPVVYEEFFLSNGIDEVTFNIPQPEGFNEVCFPTTEAFRQEYSEFINYFVRKRLSGGNTLKIVQIENMFDRLIRPKERIRLDEHSALSIVSLNHTGEFSTFSPELAGYSHPLLGSFFVGRLFPYYSIDRHRIASFQREIDQGLNKCESTCTYYSVCGGGVPSTKMFETESFSSTEHESCIVDVQWLADITSKEIIISESC